MLLEAKWAPDSGLQRGQLLTSVREAAKKWGISKTRVSRFLRRCVKEYDIRMIVVDRRTLRPNGTQDGTERGTQEGTFTRFSALLITILNYDRDQSKFNDIAGNRGTQQRTDGVPVHGTSSNNNKRRYKKNTPLSVVTANSQVYNFFHWNSETSLKHQGLDTHSFTVQATRTRRLFSLEEKGSNVINKISLIILDLIISGMGAKRCLKELTHIDPDVKVLISSGYSEEEHTSGEESTGATGFISKPYDAKEILIAIRKVLDTGYL
jgi:CheY-like chemotaxis protein